MKEKKDNKEIKFEKYVTYSLLASSLVSNFSVNSTLIKVEKYETEVSYKNRRVGEIFKQLKKITKIKENKIYRLSIDIAPEAFSYPYTLLTKAPIVARAYKGKLDPNRETTKAIVKKIYSFLREVKADKKEKAGINFQVFDNGERYKVRILVVSPYAEKSKQM